MRVACDECHCTKERLSSEWCKKTKEEQKNAYGEIKGEDAFLYIQKYRAEPQKTYLKF